MKIIPGRPPLGAQSGPNFRRIDIPPGKLYLSRTHACLHGFGEIKQHLLVSGTCLPIGKWTMNAPVKIIALLLVLLGSISPAQFPPVIDGRKDLFYSRLADADHGFLHISHTDFIPLSGPAPESDSDLSADVWIAWDETYFYLYAEVKDDLVRVNSPVRPWNDCIELKFDPDPGRKPLTGIVNARLSALDTADASDERGVDNLYPEKDSLLSTAAAHPSNYARRKTDDGYALELRLAWDWIRCRDRTVHADVGRIFGLSISVHDNDGGTGRLGVMEREGTIQWSAGMADEVWLVPQLLGTVEFASDHQFKCVKRNAIDTSDVRTKTFLSHARFKFRELYPIAIENWRYHPGDNQEWAKPGYDDRGWNITYPRITSTQKPEGGWNGIGWFRAWLVVDSSLKDVPLGFSLSQTGAAEAYLDGKLLARYGTVGGSGREEVKYFDRNLKPLVFSGEGVHLLAVRYSNFSTGYFNATGVDAGFRCNVFGDIGTHSAELSEMIRTATLFQAIFTLLPLVIGAVHLFFFFFYPRGRENLYFAMFLFCWAYIVFTDYQGVFATNLALHVAMGRLVALAIAGGIVFGMLTVYSGMYEKLPVQFYALAAAAAAGAAWNSISPNVLLAMFFLYCIMGLTAFEVLRVFLLQWRAGSRRKWITAAGMALFVIALIWQILSNMKLLPGLGSYGLIYAYGLLIFSICVSIDLSRGYANAMKELEREITAVKELSQKALEQERVVKEEEIARRLLEADNARKTKELDEARQVQLSMLPKEIPALPLWEIAVRMDTATEVGGDYYDFHLSDDGTLTVALGDATGHGAKAGTMVSISKGLFHELASLDSLTAIFEKFTTAIKHMKLGPLYMGLMLVRIKDHTVEASAAGMPPLFVYRAATQRVEQIVMKGMPLGQFNDFPYQLRSIALSPGDTILLMSDGLIEMFNLANETFDECRVLEAFSSIACKPPGEIIGHLAAEGEKWANGKPPADDVTLIVLKAR